MLHGLVMERGKGNRFGGDNKYEVVGMGGVVRYNGVI